MEPLNITIGGLDFKYRPLTLGQLDQLKDLLPKVNTTKEDGTKQAHVPTICEILAVSLQRFDKTITADTFLQMEVRASAVVDAMNTILAASGFEFRKDSDEAGSDLPGEDKASGQT